MMRVFFTDLFPACRALALVPANGRELSGTPDERRKFLTLAPARSGAKPRSGVRSNSFVRRRAATPVLKTSGNNSRPLSGARTFNSMSKTQLDARRLPFGRRRVGRRLTVEKLTRRRGQYHLR